MARVEHVPTDAPPFDFAALRHARLAAGLTQRDVALAVGVAGGERVSAWEAGRVAPRPTVVLKLAQLLDVDLELLLPGEGTLRLARIRAGLSRQDLAAAVHVSASTIFRWETGDYTDAPAEGTVERLADALGVASPELVRAFRRNRTLT